MPLWLSCMKIIVSLELLCRFNWCNSGCGPAETRAELLPRGPHTWGSYDLLWGKLTDELAACSMQHAACSVQHTSCGQLEQLSTSSLRRKTKTLFALPVMYLYIFNYIYGQFYIYVCACVYIYAAVARKPYAAGTNFSCEIWTAHACSTPN